MGADLGDDRQHQAQHKPRTQQGKREAKFTNDEEAEDDGGIFDDDYGRMRMELFKQQCRNLLGWGEEPSPPQQPAEEPSAYDYVPGESAQYENAEMSTSSEALDIVTAYKSLKLAMSKNLKGLAGGREACNGKGYLKPTMASR